ncbi:ribonuclease P [Pyrodictium occultum]|uniref:Ribonuclease P protein component 1 n=1 Tax=Pyrodictium occultum TaxID=2309 RepID=A0A0V8RWC9_PYROC|nr:ribonuclease P protein subunit [Pyrodictium occultum]KSW12363.1 ribonuclease P [Pyrodictium occultum]
MRHTEWNIIFHTLVGLRARVLLHPDPGLRGVEGRILLETRRGLLLEADGRRLWVSKANAIFLIQLPGGSWVVVRGEEIRGVQSERLKRLERSKGVGWLVRAGEKRRYTWGQPSGEDV